MLICDKLYEEAGNMSETNVEQLFRPSPGELSEVASYRDGVVTVSADTNKLRKDFLEEVRSRKDLDMSRAEEVAERESVIFYR